MNANGPMNWRGRGSVGSGGGALASSAGASPGGGAFASSTGATGNNGSGSNGRSRTKQQPIVVFNTVCCASSQNPTEMTINNFPAGFPI